LPNCSSRSSFIDLFYDAALRCLDERDEPVDLFAICYFLSNAFDSLCGVQPCREQQVKGMAELVGDVFRITSPFHAQPVHAVTLGVIALNYRERKSVFDDDRVTA